MIGIGITIFTVIILLVIAVLLMPVAVRIRVPHTVLLTFFGFSIGLIITGLESDGDGLGGSIVREVQSLGVGAEAIFYLLLPPMILQAALTINVRRLLDDIWPVLLLAIAGTILPIAAIGITVSGYSGYSVVACLMIGAIASTTDPLPIQEVFRSMGVPKQWYGLLLP